jgi:cytidylate kinase
MRNSVGRHLAHINSRPRHNDQPLGLRQSEAERLAVAISPQTGSGALQVAERLAEYLHAHASAGEPAWRVFDRNLMAKVLEDHHLPARLVKFLPEDAHSAVDDVLDELLGLHPPAWLIARQSIETILNLVRAGNVILVGWGANAVASKLPNVFHVRLVASLERRIARIRAREHLGRDEALALIVRSDRGRARYVKRYFHREVADVLLYGLVINTDHFSDVEIVRLVGDAVLNRQRSLRDGARVLPAREAMRDFLDPGRTANATDPMKEKPLPARAEAEHGPDEAGGDS